VKKFFELSLTLLAGYSLYYGFYQFKEKAPDAIIQQNTHVLEQLLQSEQQSDLNKAKQQVRKMQFLQKMNSEAEALEAKLEDEL